MAGLQFSAPKCRTWTLLRSRYRRLEMKEGSNQAALLLILSGFGEDAKIDFRNDQRPLPVAKVVFLFSSSACNVERETGIEPVASILGSWRSTAELLPLNFVRLPFGSIQDNVC